MKMAVIFIVRVYATYSANKVILYFMIALLATKEVIVIVRYSTLPHSLPLLPHLLLSPPERNLIWVFKVVISQREAPAPASWPCGVLPRLRLKCLVSEPPEALLIL